MDPHLIQRNFQFMFYGFAAVWVILVAYVISLAMRENRLKRELDAVKRMLEEKEVRK